MKTALLTILVMTSVSGAAFAADKSTPKASDVNSAGYAVQSMICSKLYVPATGNQSPTYQAGINAQGNAVAPADINPAVGADNTPDYVEVPMTIDLAKRMGLSQPGAEMKMPVANLKLYKDGRVEYNGQDISSNASSMCGAGPRSALPVENSEIQTSSVIQSEEIAMAAKMSVEPAAGGHEPSAAAASATTTQPDPRNDYRSDSVAPDDTTPQAGSVAASATSTPPPKRPIQIQRGTVNMAPRAQ